MGMTMTQKILAAHAGLSEVKAGQLIEANLDLVLGNDVTCPVAINVFEENGADPVFACCGRLCPKKNPYRRTTGSEEPERYGYLCDPALQYPACIYRRHCIRRSVYTVS